MDDQEQPITELRPLLGIHQRWDLMRRSLVHYERKDYEQGIRVVQAGLVRSRGDGMLLYTLACY